MTSLVEKLTAPEIRPKVVEACVQLVDHEVEQKPGLSGLAVKTGYKLVRALKPGFVGHVLDALLPEFAQVLTPYYEREAQGNAEAFLDYLGAHREAVAETLLGVTDARAQNAKNATIKRTYEKMRGTAREHVSMAVPGLAETLRPFL